MLIDVDVTRFFRVLPLSLSAHSEHVNVLLRAFHIQFIADYLLLYFECVEQFVESCHVCYFCV